MNDLHASRPRAREGFPQDSNECRPLLADEEQRRRALDPSASFHLEAPAGSGKTFLLTARFLCLLSLVDHPRHILAVTFTNKAAGEMLERVGRYLVRAMHGDAPSNALDAELLEMAGKALRRHARQVDLLLGGEILRIQTFHSFCYSLVSQAPLEAGVVPGAELLVEPDQVFFLREVIDETLQELLERPAQDPARCAVENRLLYLNNSWPLLARELEELMQRRETLGDLIGVLSRDQASAYILDGMRHLAEAELAALRGQFEASELGRSWSGLVGDLMGRGAEAGFQLPPDVPGSAWEALSGWQTISAGLLTQNGQPRKRFGPATGYYSGFAKTEWADRIQNMSSALAERLHEVRRLPLPDSSPPDTETLLDLMLILHELVRAYDARCRRQRLLDFSALETAALRLFDTAVPSDLQLLLDQQIRHVLIDEFQDTNYQQWNLLRRLCAGWTPGDGRTLFVVGDPKQSIYGFRKAEVRLFQEAKKGVPTDSHQALPMVPLVLHTNFRSRSHLIAWCNDLFSRTVMRNPLVEKDEVAFTAAAPSPETLRRERGCGEPPGEDGAAPAPPVEDAAAAPPLVVPDPPELALFVASLDPSAARRREAAWLAHRVAEELEFEGGDGTMGILLFARTHLPVYLEALHQQGVAVQVAEGLKLLERPEVGYLHQLCRALVLPQDHLAWASQLYSPWLSLTYDEIYAVFGEEPEPWVEKIRAYAARDPWVAEFWERLRGARQHLGHDPLAEVLESTWIALGGVEAVAHRWGSRGIASCRRYLDMLRQAEVHEPVQTLEGAERLLENAYEPVDPETARSRVSVMTVHKAKGLEFDTVYLPFMDWNPILREQSHQPPYLLERVPGRSDRHLVAVRPDRRRSAPDPLYQVLLDTHLGRRWGEAKRLFYVAATRARSQLLMSGVVSCKSGSGAVTFPTKTPLHWLNEHYGLSDLFPASGCDTAPSEGAVAAPPGDSVPEEIRKESPSGDFLMVLEPRVPAAVAARSVSTEPVEVRPAPFERERPLFRVVNPSALVEGEDEKDPLGSLPLPGQEPASFYHPRLWGIVTHRLLERYGREKTLPPLEGICSHLRREGIPEEAACRMGEAVLEEVRECLRDPWLGRFYDLPAEERWVEYALEGVHDARTLYVGVVDLAVRLDGAWWLVDFKTSRPLLKDGGEEASNAFYAEEIEKYRPQLLAYREMWCRCKGVEPASVRPILYWTAQRRWDDVGDERGSILEETVHER